MACSCCGGKIHTAPRPGGASMAWTGLRATAPVTALTPPGQICAPAPACPACGQLECLCRPRWVAGMVVSEADLNRLDAYITAKQRLHNRQLFGSGTVCGLVVTCHPCGGGVVSVSPGYALGPCGEDIVVCAPDTVDVCALIQKCRAQERGTVECRPWGDQTGCKDVQEQWVLAIRYIEQPSRNAPMLRAGALNCDCGGSCSCGGGGACTCGGAPTTARQPRSAMPTACASTVVCETYRYEVFRAPPQPDCNARDQTPPTGELRKRIQDCTADLTKLLQNPPQDPVNANMPQAARQRWSTFLGQIKATLYAHLTGTAGGFGTGRCDLLTRLCQIVIPDPALQGQAYVTALTAAATALGPIYYAALQDCLCLTLLPPCQPPEHDPRLPLAVVTVSGGHDCSVVEICNWTPLRPIVATIPNLEYWLSAFGVFEQLRNQLFCLCCQPLQPRRAQLGMLAATPLFAERAATGPTEGPAAAFNLSGLGMLGSWLGGAAPDPADLARLLGFLPETDPTGALTQRVTALEAEIARLRTNPRRPNG